MQSGSTTDEAIISRLVYPLLGDLSTEAARTFTQPRYNRKDSCLFAELLTKRQDGTLTLDEREELGSYLRVSALIDRRLARLSGQSADA